MGKNKKARSHTESDVLEDVQAMLAAALKDAAVAKKLGPVYLKNVGIHVKRAKDMSAGKGSLRHARVAEGARVRTLAGKLLVVMQDIRDSVKLAGLGAEVQRAFGVGASWKTGSPVALANSAHGMARELEAQKTVASAAGIDAQHRHDLAQLADAVDEVHGHHRSVAEDAKDDTSARAHAFAALRADAHHIRLAAGLVHRTNPAKRARFTSPVAHHVVKPRVKKPTE